MVVFIEDSRAEHFFDSMGVKWKYSNDLSFAQLSTSWLTENLGRQEVRVDKAVQEYGALMAGGSPAPAPILWFNPRTKSYDVLDGAQRLAAAETRQPAKFSAYIVITDSEAIVQRIRIFANIRLQGGHQESAEWTMEQAITVLVSTGGLSVEECASLGGWTTTQVRDKIKVMGFCQAIESAGGPVNLADTLIRVISKNADLEDFAAAPAATSKFLTYLQRMKFGTDEATPQVEKFFDISRSKRNRHQQFEKKLAEFLKQDGIATRLADPSRPRYQPMSAEGRVLKALRSTLTTVERTRDAGEPIYEMAEYFQVVNQIKASLQQIERMSGKSSGKQVKKRGR